jgi:glycerol-3-phosphate acyltransferase PlsY
MAWMEQLESTNVAQAAYCAVGAYVLGCFATGYYLVRAHLGRDIREVDSGSVGARNVGRLMGKWGFIFTVVGDFGKGLLAVWAAWHFTHSELLAALAMLAVVAGHVWPAQLRFRGGKGVATSLGALLILDWQLAAIYVAVFATGAALIRRSVLPGLFAYICLPLASYWLDRDGLKTIVIGVLGLMILLAHRKNIIAEIPGLAGRRKMSAKPEPPKP